MFSWEASFQVAGFQGGRQICDGALGNFNSRCLWFHHISKLFHGHDGVFVWF